MADSREALRQLATQIRDEHKLGANTATRVGSLLLALVDAGVNIEEIAKIFIRKDKDDRTEHSLGIGGDLTVDGILHIVKMLIGTNGSGISVLPDGTSQAVVDRIYVKIKAVFDELEVKKKTYVGGEQVLSPAGMKCIRVEELTDAYRCYFKAEEDGVEIENKFTVGQLAIAQECNVKVGISHHAGNRYYWRSVTAVGTDYIDLSKTVCDKDSDIPAAGDDIVGIGHLTDITRQGAIIMSSTGEVAPSIIMYQGINSFALADKDVIAFDFDKTTGKARMRVYGDAYIGAKDKSEYIEYKDGKVNIKGAIHIEPGSTGFENITGMEFGKVNLLRNSGFTGDYNSAKLESATELESATDLYSQSLKFWAATNATVNVDAVSHSGRSVTLNTGILVQSLYYKMIAGEKYIISFRAKGTSVSVSCAGLEKTEQLTSGYQKFICKFEAAPDTDFTIFGTCTICELQLERGTVPSEWSISPLDNNSAEAKFEALRYVTDLIKNGSVDMIGGLILASMLKLGNYVDGVMAKETAGVSGVYNGDDDVAFWAGGSYEQAIRAVMEYADNPNVELPDSVLSEIANAVITHGGRAILNDVVIRGYIYAIGGMFKGTVDAANGTTHIDADGTGWIGKILDEYFVKWDAEGNGSLCYGNIKWDAAKKLLSIFGKLEAKEGSKLGNLTINKNGAQIGGNAVFEDVNFLILPPPLTTETQEQLAARIQNSIIDQIAKSTTIFLNVNSGQTGVRYTVNLPTAAEIFNKAGINGSYGFRLTLITTSSMFVFPFGTSGPVDLQPTFRIVSRPRESSPFGSGEIATGEMHDNNDNLIDYIDLMKGDVLELYYYAGIYYLINRRN